MPQDKTVSVVIPTFNGERYIVETLQSIAAQSRPATEIVISDDQSSDGTVALIEELGAEMKCEIKVVQGQHLGISKNYLNAVRHSCGEIIIVGDQDDPWHPSRIEQVTSAFANNFDCTVISSDSLIVDDCLRPVGKTLRGSGKKSQRIAALTKRNDLQQFLKGMRLDAHTLAFRSVVKHSIFEKPLANYDDIWFEEKVVIAGLALGKLVCLADALTLYRQHSSQHTAKPAEGVGLSRTTANQLDRMKVLQDLLEENNPLALLDSKDVAVRMQTMREYLDFASARLETRLTTKNMTLWLGNFVRGNYFSFTRRGLLSFFKDGLKLVSPHY